MDASLASEAPSAPAVICRSERSHDDDDGHGFRQVAGSGSGGTKWIRFSPPLKPLLAPFAETTASIARAGASQLWLSDVQPMANPGEFPETNLKPQSVSGASPESIWCSGSHAEPV